MALIGPETKARIADALEGPFHVDAFSVVAHSRRRAFVHVDAESVVSGRCETRLAGAVIRAGGVLASPVQTYSRILRALVDI